MIGWVHQLCVDAVRWHCGPRLWSRGPREREREEGETGGRDGSYARLGHGPGWEGEVGMREGEDLAGFDRGSERERGSLAFLIFVNSFEAQTQILFKQNLHFKSFLSFWKLKLAFGK